MIPTSRQIVKCPTTKIVARLTEVRGVAVGQSSAFDFFSLAHDILPAEISVFARDLATPTKREMPTPRECSRHGEIWRPHRTTAAWFLWCAAAALRKSRTGFQPVSNFRPKWGDRQDACPTKRKKRSDSANCFGYKLSFGRNPKCNLKNHFWVLG